MKKDNKKMTRKMISIIIPVYNEEEVLDKLYDELVKFREKVKDYDFEFLFLNDGSKDKSLDMIKSYRKKDKDISYISFARNFGKEVCMLAGLDYAKGDAIVFMDADLQDPPEVINEFIKYWEMGYDDVYGRRKARHGETWLKKWTSSMYYKLVNKMSRYPIQIDTGDFRLLDRRVVNLLKQTREGSRSNKTLFSWAGYKKKEVLFDRPERAAGDTKWNYGSLINLAIDGITSITTSPLRISIALAMILALVMFIYIITLIVFAVKGFDINPINYLMLGVIFLSILNFGVLGIMGEYIGRMFKESKNRPLYFIDEYNDVKENNKNILK